MTLKDASKRGYFTGPVSVEIKRGTYKSGKGRVLKHPSWISAHYSDLLSEFEQLKGLGVKFYPVRWFKVLL